MLSQSVRFQTLTRTTGQEPVLSSPLVILECRNCTVHDGQIRETALFHHEQIQNSKVLNVNNCTSKRPVNHYMHEHPEICELVKEIELLSY